MGACATAWRRLMGALVLLIVWAPTLAQVPVPSLQTRVTDLVSMLPTQQRAEIEAQLKAFEARKGSQVAVLIVPSTAPETIEQYAIRVAEGWKLGRQGVDDGAILLVARDDRTVRIEVGYGLEGALPDAIAKRIVSEIIVPRFREGDFAGGIRAGVNQILKTIDGEPLPAPSPSARSQPSSDDGYDGIAAVLMVGFLVGAFVRPIAGRFYGGVAAGTIAGGWAWLATGSLVSGVVLGIFIFILVAAPQGRIGGGGRWTSAGGGFGRGGGGFPSSGGLGGGGFRGGGGRFGGGGASGKW